MTFEHYFLQRKIDGQWQTLSRQTAPEPLEAQATERLRSDAAVAWRIVGAAFDETDARWSYAQVFHLSRPAAAPAPVMTPSQRLAFVALILGGLIAAVSFGVRGGFGLYLGPISLDFGVGREVFALSIALQNLVWGVTQPFFGAFADRYGPFRAIMIGGVFYAAGIVLMAESTSPAMLHFSTGFLVAIGLSGTSFGIIFGAVAQLFPPERRSWALGIVGAAGSLGQFLIVPFTQTLLDNLGWNTSMLFTAVLVLMMIPMGLVFLKTRPVPQEDAPRDQTMREALSEACRHPSFWFLVMGFFVCGFHVAYISVHLPSYVVDLGLAAQTGAWALGLVGLCNVIGSYLAGVAGGRFSKKYLLSALYLGRAIVMAGFVLLPPSEAMVYVFAVAMGFLWLSTVPLTSGLVAYIYGPRYMGMLFGIVFFSHQIGGFLGAWLGGYAYDTLGSYELVWWISIGLGVLSSLVHWPIRERPVAQLAPA